MTLKKGHFFLFHAAGTGQCVPECMVHVPPQTLPQQFTVPNNKLLYIFLQGLTPQNGYVWFLPSWLADSWWHVDDYRIHGHSIEGMLDVPCSTRDMQQFVNGGYFSLSNAFFGNDLDTIVGGGTVHEWKQEYEMRVKKEVILSIFVF